MSAEEIAKEALDQAETDNQPWEQPQPITVELFPVDSFDADALLPNVLKEWVLDTAERMPCPADFVAVAALVALGSVIGAKCVVKPKRFDDWLVVPNLWGAVVALPSAKKSPAISAAMKPLDWLCATANAQFEESKSDYENQLIIWTARKKAVEKLMNTAAEVESKKIGGGNDDEK